MRTILVAGASGRLGREVVEILRSRGVAVRALIRRPEALHAQGLEVDDVVRADLRRPETRTGACRGVDAVISCAGGSLDMRDPKDRTPYRETDLTGNANLLEAELCVEALDAEPGTVIDAGGPEVLTRRRAVELAFEALGRQPRLLSVSPTVFGAAAATARPFNPRLAELLRFLVAASTSDVVAPPRGRRDLRSYFEAAASPRAA